MATHFNALSDDEKDLVRLVQPHKGQSAAWTRRNMRRRLGWTETKFWQVQNSLARKGWPIYPTGEKIKVRGLRRPLYRLLKEADHYEEKDRSDSKHAVTRTKTSAAVQRQGERDNPLSAPIFDAEQRDKMAANVLEGKRTAVPIGHSDNDPELKRADDGDEVLTEQELARLLAPMLKQHPNNR